MKILKAILAAAIVTSLGAQELTESIAPPKRVMEVQTSAGVMLPLGEIASILTPGYGANLRLAIDIPDFSAFRGDFAISGLTGVSYYGTGVEEFEASVLLIPLLAGLQMRYPITAQLSAGAELGYGITYGQMNKTYNEEFYPGITEEQKTETVQVADPTFSAVLSAIYQNQKDPWHVYGEFQFFHQSETVQGMFFNILLGVGYRI